MLFRLEKNILESRKKVAWSSISAVDNNSILKSLSQNTMLLFRNNDGVHEHSGGAPCLWRCSLLVLAHMDEEHRKDFTTVQVLASYVGCRPKKLNVGRGDGCAGCSVITQIKRPSSLSQHQGLDVFVGHSTTTLTDQRPEPHDRQRRVARSRA